MNKLYKTKDSVVSKLISMTHIIYKKYILGYNRIHVLHAGFKILLIGTTILTQIPTTIVNISAFEDIEKETSLTEYTTTETYYKSILKNATVVPQQEEDIKSAAITTEEIAPQENWEDVGVCAYSDTKTYEEGGINWAPSSMQYQVMATLHPDERGHYISDDGYLAVALGSYYGPVGSKFRITLDSGIVLNVIKADAKADEDVSRGCQHADGSILEFVVNTPIAASYYGVAENGYVNGGNFNNREEFRGTIVKVEKLV